MKICVVGSSESGHVQSRAAAVAEMGYEVVLACGRPSPLVRVTQKYPEAAPLWPWPFRKLQAFREAWRYYRVIKACPGDLTHVHFAADLGAWLALVAGRRPLVVSTMGGDVFLEEREAIGWFGIKLTRLVLGEADLVTAKSTAMLERLSEMGVAADRLMRLVWGVDTDRFHPGDAAGLREELNIPVGVPVVFSPRCAKRFYNIHLILEAFARLRTSFPEARLLIAECVCDAEYVKDLRRNVERMGLAGNVIFLGYIPYERMPEYYRLADVTVSAVASDGVPQTLLESMACGTPNLLARIDAYRGVVDDGENAVLAELDATAYAENLKRIFRDPAFVKRLSENGLTFVERNASLNKELARLKERYEALQHFDARRRPSAWQRTRAMVLLFGYLLSPFVVKVGARLGVGRQREGTKVHSWKAHWEQEKDGGHRVKSEDFLAAEAREKLFYLGTGGRLLDFGCGAAELLVHYAANFLQVVGVDFSRSMLDAANERLGRAGVENAELVNADDAGVWEAVEGNFDRITCAGVVQYLTPDQVAAFLAGASKRLKPGGRVVFFDVIDPDLFFLFNIGLTGVRKKSRKAAAINLVRYALHAARRRLAGRPANVMGYAMPPHVLCEMAKRHGLEAEYSCSMFYEYRYHMVFRRA